MRAIEVLQTRGVASESDRNGGTGRREQSPSYPQNSSSKLIRDLKLTPSSSSHPPKDSDATSSPRIKHPDTSNQMALFPQCGELWSMYPQDPGASPAQRAVVGLSTGHAWAPEANPPRVRLVLGGPGACCGSQGCDSLRWSRQ